MTEGWFLQRMLRSDARVRLFSLPYAGGSAAVYREWPAHLPSEIDFVPLQLPGRGWRLREPPVTNLGMLADVIVDVIAPLSTVPVALFGHSMGAWLALEVVRRLERRGVPPVLLVTSGRRAPALPAKEAPFSHLSNPAFVEEVQRRYGGIPPGILADREVLELLLPALRADVRALETYRWTYSPVRCPLLVLGGESDPVVPVEDLPPWAEETMASCEVVTLPGGHFYWQDDPGSAARIVADRILAALPNGEAVEATVR